MTEELMKKAKEAKSVEELIALLKDNGIELSKEKAEEVYGKLHCNGEIPEDEIDLVAGGGCNDPSAPSFQGTWVSGYELSSSCPICHNNCWAETGFIGNGPRNYQCMVCYTRKRNGYVSAPSVVPMTQECGHPNTKNRAQVWVE